MKKEQDRQCTINVIFRCVHVTIAAVEKKLVLNILSVSVFLP